MRISPISFRGMPYNYAVIDSTVSRSAQPMAKDFVWLSKHGVTDIINFRTMVVPYNDFDEEALVKQLGMKYHNIPSHTSAPTEENITKFFEIVNSVKSANGKVHMHCMAGADRTGMYAFLYKCLNHIGTVRTNEREWIRRGHDTERYPNLISTTKEFLKKLMQVH